MIERNFKLQYVQFLPVRLVSFRHRFDSHRGCLFNFFQPYGLRDNIL